MTKKERIAENKKFYACYARYRDLKGYNDHKISVLCDIPNATIYDWKYGITMPKVTTLMKIADVLGVSLDRMLRDG